MHKKYSRSFIKLWFNHSEGAEGWAEGEQGGCQTTALEETGAGGRAVWRRGLCMQSLSLRHQTHKVRHPGRLRDWRVPGTVWCDPPAISPPALAGGGIPGKGGDP